MDSSKVAVIKNIYLYLVSFVALMMVVFSVADVVNIVLKTYVFTKADRDYYAMMPCDIPPTKPVSPPDRAVPAPADCAKQQEENRKQAEENRAAQRQRDLVRDISFVVVGIPLFAYHWRVVRRKEE